MESPPFLNIKLSVIADASPKMLREIVPQFSMGKSDRKFFTIGFALYRIKYERLFLEWGYEKFWNYCRGEGNIKPTNSENWRIAFYKKYLALGFTLDDMEVTQERGHNPLIMRRIYQLCQTREEALTALADPHVAANMKTLAISRGYKRGGTGTIGPLPFSITEYEEMRGVLNVLNKQFGMNERRGLLATTLLCKVLLQAPVNERYSQLKHFCFLYGLNNDFADAVLGEEKWRNGSKI